MRRAPSGKVRQRPPCASTHRWRENRVWGARSRRWGNERHQAGRRRGNRRRASAPHTGRSAPGTRSGGRWRSSLRQSKDLTSAFCARSATPTVGHPRTPRGWSKETASAATMVSCTWSISPARSSWSRKRLRSTRYGLQLGQDVDGRELVRFHDRPVRTAAGKQRAATPAAMLAPARLHSTVRPERARWRWPARCWWLSCRWCRRPQWRPRRAWVPGGLWRWGQAPE